MAEAVIALSSLQQLFLAGLGSCDYALTFKTRNVSVRMEKEGGVADKYRGATYSNDTVSVGERVKINIPD